MTKEEALRWTKEIRNGKGVDTSSYPDSQKGELAKRLWDDPNFTYGMEYGVLIAIWKIFGIAKEG